MNDKEIQVIDFAYLRMCAEHDYIYETGEAKLLLNYITNLQQENARLKDKIDKVIKLMNSELTDVDMGECEEVHISFIKHWLKILKEN